MLTIVSLLSSTTLTFILYIESTAHASIVVEVLELSAEHCHK